MNNLADERVEFHQLDQPSFQHFCDSTKAANIPDRTMVWSFENRIGASGESALFDGLNVQLRPHGHLAQGAQIIDATIVPSQKQNFSRDERELIDKKATPGDWESAKRRQKDADANWTKNHGKSYFDNEPTVKADRFFKLARRIATDTASVHDGKHFEAALNRANNSVYVYATLGHLSQAQKSPLQANDYRSQIQRKKHSSASFPNLRNSAIIRLQRNVLGSEMLLRRSLRWKAN